ncbi:hypothetical protein HOLleu_35793 [Holothuria leucospilota]|uniref:Uncharacterized protein n=1 Tax=Holothuria leucospilota TaxID=206669 RepID=A0A9Q0YQF0_HOLLE|nr:hypothetical protein HOLleu_35793 [Holothuria leucospilota]
MKNPIAIRKYTDANHPTPQVICTTTSRTGLTIIAAQDETSQKTLLKDWKPIEGLRPMARLPKQKTARPETNDGIIEDIQRKQDETIAKTEECHQLQLEALRLQHQATIEKIEETNSQLFQQTSEDTIAQLNQLKGQITHFLGDVLTCLIPEKGDTPPSDYRKATVIKEKAWTHLGLDIDISRTKEELRKKSPRGQKTSSQ